MEGSHRGGRPGSSGDRNAEQQVSRHIHIGCGNIQEWERRLKGPGGEHMKNYGQQVMSVRSPEGFVYARARGRLQL